MKTDATKKIPVPEMTADNLEDTMGSKLVTALMGLVGVSMLAGGLMLLSVKKPDVPKGRARVQLNDAAKNYQQNKGHTERLLKTDNVYLIKQGG
jgi:hypothetical protein